MNYSSVFFSELPMNSFSVCFCLIIAFKFVWFAMMNYVGLAFEW